MLIKVQRTVTLNLIFLQYLISRYAVPCKKVVTNPNLKIYSGSMLPMTEPEPGIVTVSLSGVGSDLGDKPFVGSSKSTGSITISDRSLVIKDLTLYNSDGATKTVNAKIPF